LLTFRANAIGIKCADTREIRQGKDYILMYYVVNGKQTLRVIPFLSLLATTISVAAQGRQVQGASLDGQNSNASTDAQIRIPNRPAKPFFQGQQGEQKTEIHFDPATGMVTLKVLVQDPRGYFIPDIRRNNFAVYENGVRQQNVSVDIEHAAVSLALLMEYGGRYPALNKAFWQEVSRVGQQALDVLGPHDKLAIWAYGDTMKQVADFSQDHQTLHNLFYSLQPPGISEVNLYDALVSASERMERVAGRKAIILISSGVDTFSKSAYNDAVKAVRNSDTPIYVISMLPSLREAIRLHGSTNAVTAIDWNRAENELMEIARVSGGRFYAPDSTIELSGTYDDIIENLKVRYVITYKSTTHADPNVARTVRVALVNPSTGGPLQIMDANGRIISAKVIVEGSYTPNAVSHR
jgi:VWFA-related protein